ncbi:hypothetical protein [Paenibacillus flagellatus]|uniref:Tail fiber protein n=1 Tax=Paenibacillus flagellatus TaxID=2211139 RepID=A0A2V5KTK4_9BACL|nr:hypothetical protein [Paenibacillus flagellatus]PYI52556.1 hypothetical protein DLM86_20500 [Paenibacillus flagellatus]
MPDVTAKLGLKKPLGNETFSRAAYNENLDLIEQNAAAQSDLTDHRNATQVHGATSDAIAGRLIMRDAAGRAKVAAPTAADDIARKAEVDAAMTVASNAQAAADAAFQSASSGKNAVAAAITGMGQTASGSDTFTQLASKISSISKDATATAGEVLTGKTFYQGGTKKSGTMPNNGALGTIMPGTTNQSIPAGYTTGGTIAGDADLVPGNIRSGVNIFGVTGNVVQASGNAGAAQVLTGYTASNSSGGFSGSMPNNGAPTWVPGTSSQNLAAGYYSGGTIIGDSDLVASNIRSGVNIFGVVGSLVEGHHHAKGTGSLIDSSMVVTGLGFQPSFIISAVWYQWDTIVYIFSDGAVWGYTTNKGFGTNISGTPQYVIQPNGFTISGISGNTSGEAQSMRWMAIG